MRYVTTVFGLLVLLVSESTLYGPMHSQQGVDIYNKAIQNAVTQGGTVEVGGKVSTHNDSLL